MSLSKLAYQFSDSEDLKSFLSSFLEELAELEISGLQLLNERYLNTAVGVQLDGIGEIIGYSRPNETSYQAGLFGFEGDPTSLGFGDINDINVGGSWFDMFTVGQPVDDTLYRILLRAKAIENNTAMTVDEVTNLISFMFGGISVQYSLTTNLIPEYHLYKVLTSFEANLLESLPGVMGVGSAIYTAE